MTDAQCRTGEKVVCYLCTTSPSATSSYIAFTSQIPPEGWCMPACSCFCFASPFASLYINSSWPLSPHLDHLIIYILWTTATTPSQLNWRRAPPLLFGSPPSPFLSSTASYPHQSIVFGQATLLAFQTQIYCGLDQLGTTFRLHHDDGTVLSLPLFCE